MEGDPCLTPATARPDESMRKLDAGELFVLGALLTVGIGLVLAPLFALLSIEPASTTLSSVGVFEALLDPVMASLLLRSGWIATLTALASLILGVPIGLSVALGRARWRWALIAVHLLPLSVAPQVTAVAYANLVGRFGVLAALTDEATGLAASSILYSEVGLVLVLVVSLSPAVTLLTWAFCRGVDASVFEAGLLARGVWAVLARVLLPLVAPGVALGTLIVFLLAFSEVAAPQLLRVQVYSTVVFARLSDLSFRPGEAMSRALPLLVVTVIAAAAVLRLDRRGEAALGLKAGAPPSVILGPIGWLCGALLALAASASAAPLAALGWMAIAGPGGGFEAFMAAGDALVWSLLQGFTAATLMIVIALPTGLLWSRRPALTALVALPLLVGFVVPKVALGLGVLALWNRPSTEWVTRGELGVILALTASTLYIPLRAVKLGFDRLPTSWLEAAALFVQTPVRRVVSVLVPACVGILTTAWLLAFLLSLRDVETVLLLRPPGSESLPVRAMTLEVNSPPGLVAATVLLQLVLATAILAALSLLTRARRFLK